MLCSSRKEYGNNFIMIPQRNNLSISPTLIILILSISLYLPSLVFQFAFDDLYQIVNNPTITWNETSWRSILNIFYQATPPGDLYRPVTQLTYRLNFLIANLNPGTYHLINIILYGVVCLFVYLLIAKIIEDSKIAFFATILFIIHPLHVEVVANVSGRAELLASWFSILSLFFYAKNIKTKNSSYFLNICLTFVFFLLAIFSKESAITVFLLFITLDFLSADRKALFIDKRKLISYLIFATAIAIYLWFRFLTLQDQFTIEWEKVAYHPENPLQNLGFFDRIFPALKILGDYIGLMLLPINLASEYAQPYQAFWSNIYSISGFVSVLIFLFWIVLSYLLRKDRILFFALWVLVSFTLTSP